MPDPITPEQSVENAIAACELEATAARTRGAFTVADEWVGHAATLRSLEKRLAEAEGREMLEGWTPTSLHNRGATVDSQAHVFQTTIPEDRGKWFYVAGASGLCECEDPFDGMRKADSAIRATEALRGEGNT